MQKTSFRWLIIALLFTLNFISYVDRSAISYALSTMMRELNIDSYHMGIVLGSFGVGYLLTTFFGSIAVDRWGPKKVLMIFVLLWTFAIGLTGAATGFYTACIARLGLGLGEGPNFPAVARAVSDWLPIESRAKAFSNSLVAVPLSLAIGAPLITTLIMLFGWRSMFFILAFLLLVWCPFFYYFFTNKPHESRFVNQAELDFIHQDQVLDLGQKKQLGWHYLLTNKTLLSNNFAFFVFGYSLFFFLSWLPNFLEFKYHFNIKQIGLFAFLPWILAAILLWTGGYLSDYLYKKTKNLRYARSYPIMFGQLLTLICLIPLIYWDNRTMTLIAISFAVAFNLSNNTSFYAVNVDMAKNASARSLGLMTLGFSISGFLAPILTGAFVQWSGDFISAFLLIIGLTITSLIILFLFHHPDRDLQHNVN